MGNLFGVGGDAEANINVRAATLHVVGDLVQSIGVIIASAIIWCASQHLTTSDLKPGHTSKEPI